MAEEDEERKPEARRETPVDAGQPGTERLEEKHGPDALRKLGGRAPGTAAATYTPTDFEEAEDRSKEKWGAGPPEDEETLEDRRGEAREVEGDE